MDNTKFTKGKWEVYKPNHVGCINVSIGDINGFNGYVELWHHHYENKEVAKYNALLISKAPEMLEILKELIKTYDNERIKQSITMARCVDKAEQLIKEATEL